MITVGQTIRRVLPASLKNPSGRRLWAKAPALPPDLFAVCGHLIEVSGAYQYIAAPFSSGDPKGSDFEYRRKSVLQTRTDLASWTELGRSWRQEATRRVRAEVDALWQSLCSYRDQPLQLDRDPTREAPGWWKYAYALFIIADEASGDLGFASGNADANWANTLYADFLEAITLKDVIPPSDPSVRAEQRHRSRHVPAETIAFGAEETVVRVLPKGRTTELGCVMRTLSHNLALLPPAGYARAHWNQSSQTASNNFNDLNVLLVPFPYVIRPGSFYGIESEKLPDEKRWGRFRVAQTWLNPPGEAFPPIDESIRFASVASSNAIADFIEELLRQSERAGSSINIVVLPEYALDWATYDVVARRLRDNWPQVSTLISGVSVDCNQNVGNLVTTTRFEKSPRGSTREAESHSRRKHHRWLVEESQIRGYGLEDDLSPDVQWWEYLELGERVLQMDVVNNSSTLTAVICEDLARVDPALAILRSVGPNLVVALLMDGAQIKQRWPGTYATTLADDPGSSVLSFTSLGLIERSNAVRGPAGEPTSRSIALWKNRPIQRPAADGKDDFLEVSLGEGFHAKVLSLRSARASETTMDGRSNSDASAWYLRDKIDLKVDDNVLDHKGWKWIVGL